MADWVEPQVTTKYWDESLFDCSATEEGSRKMDEMARRYQAVRLPPNKEPLVIQDTEDEYGAEVINSGKTRVVIDMPDRWHRGTTDCVAKIQWDPNYHQTAREIDIWENASGRVAAMLAPVLDRSDTKQWLMMPRAEFYSSLTAKEAGDIVTTLERELRNLGVKTTDLRRGNVGRINGRDVVIDYGNMEI